MTFISQRKRRITAWSNKSYQIWSGSPWQAVSGKAVSAGTYPGGFFRFYAQAGRRKNCRLLDQAHIGGQIFNGMHGLKESKKGIHKSEVLLYTNRCVVCAEAMRE